MTAAPGLRRNRDFLLLWTGAGLGQLAWRADSIVYPLLVLWHTGSPAQAGLVGLAVQLPQLVAQLPAGVLVDRWNRRRTMLACDAGRALLTGALAAGLLLGHWSLPVLLAVAFLEGALGVFHRLADRALVRTVVHPDDLSAALSRHEARGRAAGLIGQPAGTALFALLRWLPFVFTTLAYLVSLISVWGIRATAPPAARRRERSLTAELADGVRAAWSDRFLRVVMFLVAGSNVLFQVFTLAVIMIIHDAGGSPAAVGVVMAMSGAGGVAGALTGNAWTSRLSTRAVVITGFAAWAVLIPLAVPARHPVLLGLLYALMSYIGAVFNVAGAIYQVRTTPDAQQGRVASVLALLGSGANALGPAAGGAALSAAGTGHVLLGLGAVMLALAVVAVLSPSLRAPAPDAVAHMETV
ncbi:MFS transporter [Catenuloplanes indicus]|uniref:MFS family arabinose efflux permease n=1 Tax=Catenuloplanes indicus TaxID=137267 RepID=A0AAE3VU59_9ACTN|nr:MFS transporter [Catenuloplanes indicus]MDQ0363876.1 putative MFS family arabinose efflux permease [Catenuloplanes indicus]